MSSFGLFPTFAITPTPPMTVNSLQKKISGRSRSLYQTIPQAIPATWHNAGVPFLWISPAGLAASKQTLILDRLDVSWNGGDTDHNRVVKMSAYLAFAAPTLNGIAGSCTQCGTGLPIAEIDCQRWNGAGGGLDMPAGSFDPSSPIDVYEFGQGLKTVVQAGIIAAPDPTPGVGIIITADGTDMSIGNGLLAVTQWLYTVQA